MSKQKSTALITVLLLIICLLSSCGSKEKEKASEETKDKPISFSIKKNEENKTQFSAVEQVMAMQDNTEGLSKEEEETVKKVLKFKI